MPLNPPSYSGQDVWYSPNVFVNKVQTALWQPAQPMDSALNFLPAINLPKYSFSSAQQAQIEANSGTGTTVDANGNTVTHSEADAVNPDAAPGQTDGPTITATSGIALAPGANPYETLIKNLTTCLQESKGGGWDNNGSNQNLQKMLTVTGVSKSVLGHPTAWCATWLGYLLYLSGLPYQQTGKSKVFNPSAASYLNYGTGLSPQAPNTWRLGDVALVTRPAGSGVGYHVAFMWGIFTPTNSPLLLGGNQGPPKGFRYDKVGADPWYPNTLGNGQFRVAAVRRFWDLPPGRDIPLKNYTSAP